MNKILSVSLPFITGAAIASFVTYKVIVKKYKDIADEEIASVKEMYERKINKMKGDKEEIKEDKADKNIFPTTVPYSSIIKDCGYSDSNQIEAQQETRKGLEDMNNKNIEIISPEEFGESDYPCQSLTYYADKILASSFGKYGEEALDINKYVGPKALTTFGEYEDDSVFVRNHNMKTDFEILLDNRRYSDVKASASCNDVDEND